MAKSKELKSASKQTEVKSLSAVKGASVTKPSQTPNTKSKQIAKETAAKINSSFKKPAKKAATPSSSESEDSDSDSEMKDAKPVIPTNGKVSGKAHRSTKQEVDTSDSSISEESESDSDDESSEADSDNEKTAAKPTEDNDSSDSSEEDSNEESDDETPKVAQVAKKAAVNGAAINGAAKAAAKATKESSDEEEDDSSDSSASSDDDEEAEDASSGSDSGDDSSESESEAEVPSKKRKAEDEQATSAKKSKVEAVDENGPKNLFVGNLSWNVDDEWLYREFEEFGEIAGARVVTDRDSGRSKGFGYVDFNKVANCAAALKAKKGTMIDGREANVDFSTPRDNTAPKERANNRAKQFGDSQNPPSDTLFLGNLSFDADENTVGEAFGAHGTVTNVRLPTDQETGNPKGFGYVSFASVDDAKAAYEAMTGAEIAGRPVRLDYATPKPDRGDGGGRGGRGGRGGFNDRARGGRGGGFSRGGRGGARGGARGGRGGSTNRGGFGDFQGKKQTFK